MAKPEQPKDIKPKTEGEGGEAKEKKAKKPVDENMKVIVINLVTTVLICVLFTSITYVLTSTLLDSKLAKQPQAADDGTTDDTAGDDSDIQKGFIVDLGDFILNLSDASPKKYLKANVALEVSKKPEESGDASADGAKAEGGEGKEGAAAGSPIETEMAQYKPAIRDAVITTLSSKTAAELSTTAGKELAKEQLADAINGIFAGDREVIRVSFGDFIIQ